MKRFQAVIFDMDGLLLDTERIALACFLEACEHFGIGDQTALFMQCVGTNSALGNRILRQGLEGKADPAAFGHFWTFSYKDRTTRAPVPLKPGVVDLLDHLDSLSVPAGVATSTESGSALPKLQSAGILHRFDGIVCGDHVANSKPLPDIYLKAAETLSVLPETCLALEDSENGVRSALHAKMTVIQIPDLVPPSRGLSDPGRIILGSLHEVIGYFRKFDHVFAGNPGKSF